MSTSASSRLAHRTVYFAHQSVGRDIMAGVASIAAADAALGLRVVETTDPAQISGPGLYHARVGKNGEPATKVEALKRMVAALPADGIAMVKYCYIDATHTTDPRAMFDDYRRGMDQLRAERPGLGIVHVTMPLTMDRGLWFHAKTKLLGHRTDRRLGSIRHRFNELMRGAFEGREPLFDVAALESRDAQGRPSGYRYGGRAVPSLAPEWTHDGGHLNSRGQERMGRALIETLARL